MNDLAILTGIRDRVRAGDACFIFDEDLTEALEAAGRLGDTDVADIRRLAEDRERTDREAREQCARNLDEAREALAEYRSMAADLVREIEAEEERTGCSDPTHWRYATFCTAGRKRLRSLHEAIDDLEEQVADYEGRLS